MAESRRFYTADPNRNEDLPAGKSDEDITDRTSDEDDEEFDDVEDLDEDEDDIEESDR